MCWERHFFGARQRSIFQPLRPSPYSPTPRIHGRQQSWSTWCRVWMSLTCPRAAWPLMERRPAAEAADRLYLKWAEAAAFSTLMGWAIFVVFLLSSNLPRRLVYFSIYDHNFLCSARISPPKTMTIFCQIITATKSPLNNFAICVI